MRMGRVSGSARVWTWSWRSPTVIGHFTSTDLLHWTPHDQLNVLANEPTALNAWAALPPHDYKPLIEKYGDRFQMQDLDKVKPISSGLLGTVQLVTRSGQ